MIPVTTPEMIPEAVPIAMSVAIRIRFFFYFRNDIQQRKSRFIRFSLIPS